MVPDVGDQELVRQDLRLLLDVVLLDVRMRRSAGGCGGGLPAQPASTSRSPTAPASGPVSAEKTGVGTLPATEAVAMTLLSRSCGISRCCRLV
ncbi:hypothetical protein ACFQ0B_56040 [Nonomuraea thailandensis]